MRMTWSAKKASPLLNVNTLVGNDRTNSIFIYQTWIFCKKIGSNRSFLPEIGAQTFCYIPWGVATAYSIDIANWVGQSTTSSLTPLSFAFSLLPHPKMVWVKYSLVSLPRNDLKIKLLTKLTIIWSFMTQSVCNPYRLTFQVANVPIVTGLEWRNLQKRPDNVLHFSFSKPFAARSAGRRSREVLGLGVGRRWRRQGEEADEHYTCYLSRTPRTLSAEELATKRNYCLENIYVNLVGANWLKCT